MLTLPSSIGQVPLRPFGWVPGQGAPPPGAPGQQYHNAPYAPQPYGNTTAPPVYSPPPQPQYNQYGGGNQGYFGGQQQTGVELQQPSSTYQGVYNPPAGPPPTKH